ncbi:hypothetical protein [Microvirga solisilvae]|nr:hypothetical protein [Microvirga solisilvae]
MQADTHRKENTRGKRVLWFVLMYMVSLAVFAGLVYGFKLIIPR